MATGDNPGMKTIRLRPGKERSLQRRHPWIFDSAIAKGGGDSGETVRVESHEGQFLAWAAFSPSRASARGCGALTRRSASMLLFHSCLRPCNKRQDLIYSNGVRLVHGESDGLPGLIVDRYGDTLVAQFTSAGTERWKGVLADALLQATGLSACTSARTPACASSKAGSRHRLAARRPAAWAGEPPLELTIHEHDWRLTLDIAEGHKTGFYLDQRDSRKRFADCVQRLGCAC
jgi:23S rRNA (cytosine1962-C5)-methyltransferase